MPRKKPKMQCIGTTCILPPLNPKGPGPSGPHHLQIVTSDSRLRLEDLVIIDFKKLKSLLEQARVEISQPPPQKAASAVKKSSDGLPASAFKVEKRKSPVKKTSPVKRSSSPARRTSPRKLASDASVLHQAAVDEELNGLLAHDTADNEQAENDEKLEKAEL